QQTFDGGYIIAGYSESKDGDVSGNHGKDDFWIIKLDNLGKIEWQKSFGGSYNEFTNSIQNTTDGGFILAGVSESKDGDVIGNNGDDDFWIVKLDKLGKIEWQKSLGGKKGTDFANSIKQTLDGGYIVAGYSDSDNGDVSGNHGN